MVLGYVVIIHTCRKLCINIIVVEVARSTKRHTEVGVQCVSAPECSATSLDFNVVQPAYDAGTFIPVKTNSKSQICNDAKLTPAMIDARLGAEIVALQQPCLHTSQPYGAAFL